MLTPISASYSSLLSFILLSSFLNAFKPYLFSSFFSFSSLFSSPFYSFSSFHHSNPISILPLLHFILLSFIYFHFSSLSYVELHPTVSPSKLPSTHRYLPPTFSSTLLLPPLSPPPSSIHSSSLSFASGLPMYSSRLYTQLTLLRLHLLVFCTSFVSSLRSFSFFPKLHSTVYYLSFFHTFVFIPCLPLLVLFLLSFFLFSFLFLLS